jgi:hypothetical protein
MPVIISPSQLFRYNDRRDPTHLCFVYQLKPKQNGIPVKLRFSATSGVLFRNRSYVRHAGATNGAYICELYVPANGSPEISNPTWLGMCVADEFRREMEPLFEVSLVGVEDYSRYHSESTDEDECYL